MREADIEEEKTDLHLHLVGHLAGKMVNVIKVKETITSIAPFLTIVDRQARDDSWQGHIFGMLDLQLRLGGRSAIEEEMLALEVRYPLIKSAILMY